MKQINITIHPFSALIGAAIVCLTMLTVGAVTVQGSSSTRDVSAIEVFSPWSAEDVVRIYDTGSYVVPAGKHLVLTALGNLGIGGTPRILINGNTEIQVNWHTTSHDFGGNSGWAWSYQSDAFTSMLDLPAPGLIALSGQTVSTIEGRAWGYLVDA
jgi:hypothetical protein